MNKIKIIQVASLIGACLTGAALILNGDVLGGFGVIGAAMSSASVFGPPKTQGAENVG